MLSLFFPSTLHVFQRPDHCKCLRQLGNATLHTNAVGRHDMALLASKDAKLACWLGGCAWHPQDKSIEWTREDSSPWQLILENIYQIFPTLLKFTKKKQSEICANSNLRRYLCLWVFWQKCEIWDAARGFFFLPFFSQKPLLFPSLWLSATERHSLPSSPASVGEVSFNTPALWGKGRRSSLIGLSGNAPSL